MVIDVDDSSIILPYCLAAGPTNTRFFLLQRGLNETLGGRNATCTTQPRGAASPHPTPNAFTPNTTNTIRSNNTITKMRLRSTTTTFFHPKRRSLYTKPSTPTMGKGRVPSTPHRPPPRGSVLRRGHGVICCVML